MKTILRAFIRNSVFANILLGLIIFVGIMASRYMIRETFPEFSLDMITVTVPWPGADPEDVEEGICIKLERAIMGIPGISQFSSTSGESVGRLLIEVEEDYDIAVKYIVILSPSDEFSIDETYDHTT